MSFTIPNINYNLVVDEILKFLKANQEIILDEHHEELLNLIIFVKKFDNVTIKTSDHGCHFLNCPWSSKLCKEGPDTCACYMVENKLLRIKKLMALYKRLK